MFHMDKRLFDQEVSKWDERGNDVIVLANRMCMIMMEMADFTNGKYIILLYSNYIGQIRGSMPQAVVGQLPVFYYYRRRPFTNNHGSHRCSKANIRCWKKTG